MTRSGTGSPERPLNMDSNYGEEAALPGPGVARSRRRGCERRPVQVRRRAVRLDTGQ